MNTKLKEDITKEQNTKQTHTLEALRREEEHAKNAAEEFRGYLTEYLVALTGRNGNGDTTMDYCLLCIDSGLHDGGGRCGCVCHRARKGLSRYIDDCSSV